MAHRCWALDEIVRAIAADLVANSARASAVALACCSKTFEEPALGEVWRCLSSLVPLVKCFPPEVWKDLEDDMLVFKRAPLRAEWTRFQKHYASKVQYLDLRRPSFLAISLPALHVLQLDCSGGSLLPNLISLIWASNETYLPFISLFISPSLTSIYIDMPLEASPMLPPILNRLSALSHNMRGIKIRRVIPDPSMEEASSQLLLQCNHHLLKFQVGSPISTSALRHLMQLPSLEELALRLGSFQLPDPLPFLVFPSLQQLHVGCNSDTTWLKLLPAIENPVLMKIVVNCAVSHVEEFMETFQLTITGCAVCESLQEFSLESPDDFTVTPRIIACNFLFKNLRSLKLLTECSDICQTWDLADVDIDLLTNALPCLECLAIGGEPCGVPSQITFKSLYTISHRCTRLTTLRIHFNPALFINKVGKDFEPWNVAIGLSESPSSDLCSVKTVFVGKIPLPTQYKASCVMALGLLEVFPHLETIEYENRDWRNVQDLIGVGRSFALRKGQL